ncbi:FAD-binding protein [Curtobacterium sp. MCJR17_043]|nr:FAD-binding protein [Curtobacterium sp. MCJR17_043]WIB35411.1 FAD-binding protein [Curtobacterium sp. MCJR17_043]
MRAQGGRPVLLDATGLDPAFLLARFPGLTRATRAVGVDWTREGVPVAPAAHYAMGGVATDTEGRTSLPGLSAVGEVACTGVHGANRLASNSLLEGLVFAVRAADALGSPRPDRPRLRGDATLAPTVVADPPDGRRASRPVDGVRLSVGDRPGGPGRVGTDTAVRDAVQAVMTEHVGLLRDAAGLAEARRVLAVVPAPLPTTVRRAEDRALLDLARVTALAAEARTESRGAHARTDHPDTDPTAPMTTAWVRARPAGPSDAAPTALQEVLA